jgi:hypothetical protein
MNRRGIGLFTHRDLTRSRPPPPAPQRRAPAPVATDAALWTGAKLAGCNGRCSASRPADTDRTVQRSARSGGATLTGPRVRAAAAARRGMLPLRPQHATGHPSAERSPAFRKGADAGRRVRTRRTPSPIDRRARQPHGGGPVPPTGGPCRGAAGRERSAAAVREARVRGDTHEGAAVLRPGAPSWTGLQLDPAQAGAGAGILVRWTGSFRAAWLRRSFAAFAAGPCARACLELSRGAPVGRRGSGCSERGLWARASCGRQSESPP